MSLVITITSAANPQIKKIKSLELRKYRKEYGLFLSEGLRSVIEGVSLGFYLEQLIIHQDSLSRPDVQKVISACKGSVLAVNDSVLSKLSHKDNPQTVLGVFRQRISTPDSIQQGLWVGLDQVRDPGNLGTIIRTVDAVAGQGVILIGSCCDPYAPESVRASMGSIFNVALVSMTEESFINWRKKSSYELVGTALQTDTDYRSVPYKKDMILLMGNEQAGLSDTLRDACNHLVKMPMKGRADSLNLAVATGVMLYKMID